MPRTWASPNPVPSPGSLVAKNGSKKADDDVSFDGDDLLVTVHLSGCPPRTSFWVRVYIAVDGRNL
jgi:hypothetical protein